MKSLDRRALLRLSGLASALGLAWGARRTGAQAREQSAGAYGTMDHAAHRAGPVGRTALDAFNPSVFLRAWNFSDPHAFGARPILSRNSRPDGTLLREYDLVAVDREIEIAPGVFFPAWTFNGQVPGPTLRATEDGSASTS